VGGSDHAPSLTYGVRPVYVDQWRFGLTDQFMALRSPNKTLSG
jgi:hypothetical protein